MSKRFIPFVLFLFFVCTLGAQRPVFVPVDMRVTPDASRAACDSKAGTCVQAVASGSKTNDKKYLCYNDKLNITHNKDQNLSGDPKKSTPAGVGYLLATCAPTKTGPTIQDVATDPCLLKTPTGTTPTNGFYVFAAGKTTGDVQFFNDGYYQTTYGGGKPFRVFFAPITFDKPFCNL
jgi:hypothetical protein